jgi:glycosyltransferase involved in cell wall biosynthesis
VLFFATRDLSDPGTTGGDITMWEYARYLASVGHSVTYAAGSYSGSVSEEIVDGIHVTRLGGIHTLWLSTFVRYMLRWRGRFDVVVTEGFGGSRIPRFAPLYVREPVITEWHQIHRDLFAAQYPRFLGAPLNLLERVTAWVHRDTLVRAGTLEWQRLFPTIGFKPKNVFLLPVSIREEWFTSTGLNRATEPAIVWLGKLRRYKCPDHAISAMSNVVNDVPDAHLLIAGRHDDRRYELSLANTVRGLGLTSNVAFRFDLSEAEKRTILRASKVLVLPSAVEGFGVVVLEANSCGVPVIASSRVPEGAVRDGYNGLRYPFGDITRLADLIVQVLTDDELRQRLAANGVAFARDFGWQRVGAQFERVIEHAVRREPVEV